MMESRLILNPLAIACIAVLAVVGCGSETDDPAGSDGPASGNETLDEGVDWEAWDLIYTPMYSAYDGEHVFSLPAYVSGLATELEDWQAIPSDAVTFSSWQSDDGTQVGVLITVNRAEPEVTIAASNGEVGGKTTLYITDATTDQWEVGQNRYKNGAEFDLMALMSNPEIFQMISFENGMPVFNGTAKELGLETNLRCDGCHTTEATQFQVEHTPTQASRFSDEDLVRIFTMGMKPPGVEFRAIPERFQSFYAFMHTWEVTQEEVDGLIVYLRSLTPKGQGDILLPTGMYASSDFDFNQLPDACNPQGGMFDIVACREQLPPECRRSEPTFDLAMCMATLGLGMPGDDEAAPADAMP